MSLPQDQSEDDRPHPPTLAGIAAMMVKSPDQFTQEVGALLADIALMHDYPTVCATCNLDGPCSAIGQAHHVAFAWLLKVVEKRG